MKQLKCNVIHLKKAPRDMNGLEEVIFATDNQVAKLITLRNDTDKRYNLIKIDRFYFSSMDVAFIEQKSKETYELPKYFLERYEKETTEVVKIT